MAVICAAPNVPGSTGLLKGRTTACYPGFEEQLIGVLCISQGVVTDGDITIFRELGYTLDPDFELTHLLQGPQQAQKTAVSIQHSRR